MPEPIAYLYNGIQLPVPPEWDKETYPYATMQLDGSTGNYFLWLTSTRPCKSIIHLAINPSGVGVVYATKASEGHTTWYQADKWDEGESPFGALTSAMWANYDIFKTDGITVYLESSEPIPVYE